MKEIQFVGSKTDAVEAVRGLSERASTIFTEVHGAQPQQQVTIVEEVIGIRKYQIAIVRDIFVKK